MSYCLEVVKQDLAQSRVTPLQAIEDYALADGEAMIRVDRFGLTANNITSVSYTHLRAHETSLHLVCRLLLEKKK